MRQNMQKDTGGPMTKTKELLEVKRKRAFWRKLRQEYIKGLEKKIYPLDFNQK